MKIKNFNKQLTLKSINTTGNIDKTEYASMYSGPSFAMASRHIENGLLDCRQLLDSKMFYNISNTGYNNCSVTISSSSHTTTTTDNNVSSNYTTSTNKYESIQSILSNNEQDLHNLKSLPKHKLLLKQYTTMNMPILKDDVIIHKSNKLATLMKCNNTKLNPSENTLNEPEYIQMKSTLNKKRKSMFINRLHIKSFTCSNRNYNFCLHLSDYIHANNKRKQIVIVIIVLSVLLLIIIIITMIILHTFYYKLPTSPSYTISSRLSSSELNRNESLSSRLSTVNQLSHFNKQYNTSTSTSMLTTTYINTTNNSKINQNCKTQKFCLNISCLQIASILAECLGRYNRPKSIKNILDNKCTSENIDQVIKIFYIGDEFHLSTNENSLYRFKQKRLSTLWSYVSDELQKYIIEDKKRPLLLWTEKLAYLFQHLIDHYMFKKNVTNITTNTTYYNNMSSNNRNNDIHTLSKPLDDNDNLPIESSDNQMMIKRLKSTKSFSLKHPSVLPDFSITTQSTLPNKQTLTPSLTSTMKIIESNEFEMISMSHKTELEQLNDLLQLGNIAFHGLDDNDNLPIESSDNQMMIKRLKSTKSFSLKHPSVLPDFSITTQSTLPNKQTLTPSLTSTMKIIESNEFEMISMSHKTELEQLNDLLQLGNIAFHGLDNVLINVQLNLRVPLFFTAWIERTHTPGLMDSLIPMLDTYKQPELPTLVELENYIPHKSKLSSSSSTSSSTTLFKSSSLHYSTSLSSSAFLWNRVHELQNYIHHLGHLAWKARYSHLLNKHSSNDVKYLNLSGVLPVLHKLKKLNHLSEMNTIKVQKMTLRELMQITQHTINFPRYLGKLTSWNYLTVMPRDMQVWVTNIDYYDKLGRMLQQTSFSELQDYITFAILHKYGEYVDQQTAQLKSKLLKSYAESLGIDQVSYWPFLLDLASPGLNQILQSRWSLAQLNHATKQFHYEILTPVQNMMNKLLNRSMPNTTECHDIINKISNMKLQLMSQNGHNWMENFYSELKIQPKQNLLIQLVQFNNFLSKKAISTDLSKLIPDLGLSSGGSKLFQYVESSNTIECFDVKSFYQNEQDEFDLYVKKVLLDSKMMDQWVSWSKTPNVFQSILATEITGRIYKEYLHINHKQPDSNLPGIFLTNKELFYQWIFQLICPGFDYYNIITHNHVLLHSIQECDAIRTAVKLSPTFRWFMECPLKHSK
ncbi:hypothetical protein MN116_007135 [Schistosoma mekongi]|uniref:Peptidase M13 N-terminal domain-containing protein n=1 Tax=Schistosoma mekongi TaxID=38744 RepID=A0AAE2D3B7_SCHME|nr:hypothetical protein MN116_007135 [Schistosoma mekongi]